MNTTANKDTGTEPVESHDIFEDPTVSKTLREDPIMKTLIRWWQQILVAALVVAAVIYARHRFTEAYYARLGEASDVFSRASGEMSRDISLAEQIESVRKDLASTTGDPKKQEELQKKIQELESERNEVGRRLQEVLAALGDTRPQYSNLVPFYRVLMYQQKGDIKSVLNSVDDPENWATVDASKQGDRFVAELLTLVYSRSLLDDPSESQRAKTLLKQLAESAVFARVPAALTLSKIAQGEQERADVAGLLERISKDMPEQSDLIKDELARLQA